MFTSSFLLDVAVHLVKILVVFHVVLITVAYMVLVERKVSGRIQARFGPNRVGPYGLLQPLADGLKFIFKEEVFPAQANKVIYTLAPVISVVTALTAYAVIPFGPPTTLFGLFAQPIPLQIAELNVGILYPLAILSLGIYGIVLAGWSSNSKYSLLGGLRSSAQMFSYELAMGLSLIGVLMITQSLSLSDVVEGQSRIWYIFLQPIGFIIFLVAAFAETNRLPFDLPEAEPELTAGFHTEYSSMKFAMFFMAEYANMVTLSALIVTLFLGGWQGPPFLGYLGIDLAFLPGLGVLWFLLKMAFFLFFFVWVRWTLPRLRYDQLMALGWKVFLPLALLNVILTGLGIVLWEGL